LNFSVASKTVAFYVFCKVTSDHRMSNITSEPHINEIALKTSQKCFEGTDNYVSPSNEGKYDQTSLAKTSITWVQNVLRFIRVHLLESQLKKKVLA
jgi:hypothetical protein